MELFAIGEAIQKVTDAVIPIKDVVKAQKIIQRCAPVEFVRESEIIVVLVTTAKLLVRVYAGRVRPSVLLKFMMD